MDSDGKPRANLSVLSGHTRLAQIGRNRKRKPNGKKAVSGGGEKPFFDDPLPPWGTP